MVKILLEGRPGVGKTTLAIAILDALADRGVEVGGFTTEEIRERGGRVGFAIEDFSALRWLRERLRNSSYFQLLDMIADPDDPRDLYGMILREEQRALAA